MVVNISKRAIELSVRIKYGGNIEYAACVYMNVCMCMRICACVDMHINSVCMCIFASISLFV